MSKKIIRSFMILFLITTQMSFAKVNDHPTAELIMNLTEGTILKEVHSDLPLSVASTSKIMTYVLVMDAITNGELKLDTIVTVMPTAVQRFGSNYRLKKWDKLSIMELLESMLIISANDSALVLAEAVSGSQNNFVRQMNARAKGLQLDSAVFYNPNGLPEEDLSQNTMTATDLAKLYAYAIKQYPYPLKKIVAQPIFNGRYKPYRKKNSNALLDSDYPIYGMKTGYTHDAGFCFVGYVKTDSTEYLTVLLNGQTSDERYHKTIDMLLWVDDLAIQPLFFEGERYGSASVQGISYDFFVAKDIIELSHPDQRLWRADLTQYPLNQAISNQTLTVKQQDHIIPLTIKPSLTLEYESRPVTFAADQIHHQNNTYFVKLKALAERLDWRLSYNNTTKITTVFNERFEKSYLPMDNLFVSDGTLYVSLDQVGSLFNNTSHWDDDLNRFIVEEPDNSDSQTD